MSGDSGVTFDVAACRAHLRARQEQEYQVREARRQAALQAVRAAACAVLPRFPHVRRAYLFGSVLRPGGMRSTSDVDVAVEGELGAEEYFALCITCIAPLKTSFSVLLRSLGTNSPIRLAGTPICCTG